MFYLHYGTHKSKRGSEKLVWSPIIGSPKQVFVESVAYLDSMFVLKESF